MNTGRNISGMLASALLAMLLGVLAACGGGAPGKAPGAGVERSAGASLELRARGARTQSRL